MKNDIISWHYSTVSNSIVLFSSSCGLAAKSQLMILFLKAYV